MPAQTTSVGMSRKLTAILSADVKGYSRLMGEDEEATIRTLTAYRALISLQGLINQAPTSLGPQDYRCPVVPSVPISCGSI